MDNKTLQFYDDNFAKIAEKYDSVSDGIDKYFSTAFVAKSKILDIGCGSGRDLRFLLNSQFDAFAIDPCEKFVNKINSDFKDKVFIDSLPNIAKVADNEFDGVLCSAVLMHLPKEQLFDASFAIRRVLRENGRLLISIPLEDETIDKTTNRDKNGRLFNGITPDELQLIFERIGFKLINCWQNEDSLNRGHRKWSTMLFTLENVSGTRPIDTIESVLNRDKKVATYKLALFRSLAELAMTNYNLALWNMKGEVIIPVANLAEKWIEYYWPIFESDKFIPQIQGEMKESGKPVAFRELLTELIKASKKTGGLSGFANFAINSRNKELPKDIDKLHKSLISKLKTTLINGPIKYAGGNGNDSVFGYANGNIIIPAGIWRELSLMGSWIQDATILRWAELTSRLSKDTIKASEVIDCLLTVPIPERDVYSAKSFYDSLKDKECVWSGRSITKNEYDVDHAIPFGLWKNNDLWNLFPANSKINGNKKDKLPSNILIKKRKDCVVHYWDLIKEKFPARFEYEAEKFGGLDLFKNNNWENKLFANFAEAIEITAIQRGVERWEPASFAATGTDGISLQPADSAELRNSQKNIRVDSSSFAVEYELEYYNFEDIKKDVYKRYLPFVGKLTANPNVMSGFYINDLESEACEMSWLKTDSLSCKKNRFIIQVIGDSMESTINKYDYVICEYHRRCYNSKVVIMQPGIQTFNDGDCAVKRLSDDKDNWIFKSDNKKYNDIIIPKDNLSEGYPIIGEVIYNLTKQEKVL